jgi:predicted dehydrogenase
VSALYDTRFPTRTLDDGAEIPVDVEDIALVSLTLANGALASLTASWNGSVSHLDTRKHVTVTGRGGFIQFGLPDGGVYVFRPDGKYENLGAPHEPALLGGYACRRLDSKGFAGDSTILEEFFRAIERGETGIASLRTQIHVMEIIQAVYRIGSKVPGAASFRCDPPARR